MAQENNAPNNVPQDKNSQVVKEGKIFAVLAYLGILCLIPLLLKKDNEFARFHGKQGLVIFIIEVVAAFVNIIPFLGQLIWVLAFLYLGAVSIIAIIQVLMGNYWRIPLISQFADKIAL
jgi:uncharacterized membrane protein